MLRVESTKVELLVLSISFYAAVLVMAVLRRDHVFAIMWGLIVLYTVFTQVAYLVFPDELAGHAGSNAAIFLRGSDAFFQYWLFVNASMLSLFVLRVCVRSVAKNRIPKLSLQSVQRRPNAPWVALGVVGGYTVALVLVVAVLNGQVSYLDNSWKDARVVAFLVFLFPLFTLFSIDQVWHGQLRRRYLALLLVMLLTMLVFMLASGDRNGIATTALGFIVLAVARPRAGRKVKFVPIVLIGSVTALALLTVLLVRSERHTGELALASLPRIFSASTYDADSVGADLVFEDYWVPSLTLLYSIDESWISQRDAVIATASNVVPFTDRPALDEAFAARVGKSKSRHVGFGFFILTEAFLVARWWGIVYIAVVLNLGLLLWDAVIPGRTERGRAFMLALVAMSSLLVARGQSFMIIKSLFLILLPGAYLLSLACGRRLGWRPTNAVGRSNFRRRV